MIELNIKKTVLILASIALVLISTLYLGIYYHETINKEIFAEYNISSRINLFFPYNCTEKFFDNNSCASADTVGNAIQYNQLNQTDPLAIAQMNRQIAVNENYLTQSAQLMLFGGMPTITLGFKIIKHRKKSGKK